MAGSNTNMEVIILSLTIYTLAHHHQYLTGPAGSREEQKSLTVRAFFGNEK